MQIHIWSRHTAALQYDVRCLVCFVVNSAMITYNAALWRPAYQSSVHRNEYGRYGAHLANDGSRETRPKHGGVPRCSISRYNINPWWAVDLVRPTEVYAVNFTNVRYSYGMYKIEAYFEFIFSTKVYSRSNRIRHL